MQIEEELVDISPGKDMLLTIGVFDGVHLGHKYLISQLIKRATEQNLSSGVVTFRQHPLEILSPKTKLSYLTDISEKADLLKREGVGSVIQLSFTTETAQLSARQFAGLLKKHLRMQGLVIGPDFALGRNREGNVDILGELGQDIGFSVTVVPPVKVNGDVVSSTAIREALADGNIKRVINLIGRPFSLKGRIATGEGRGSKLGFPTANLELDEKLALPADGVYATWAGLDGKSYRSMTNVGFSPTFDGKERTVETFILDYNGEMYGRELKIDFVERLRGEKKFETIEELKEQIAEDVKKGEDILKSQAST